MMLSVGNAPARQVQVTSQTKNNAKASYNQDLFCHLDWPN